MDWQPIETMLLDGTLVLMWLPADDDLGYVPTVQVGFCDRRNGIQSAGICAYKEDGIEPTHRMPMPPEPE